MGMKHYAPGNVLSSCMRYEDNLRMNLKVGTIIISILSVIKLKQKDAM